ncbi:MAG: HAMP domain-containing protein [Bacteroidia bacterium]|nr:HAMP domain-containing protein [Bacteroidia bacterium]
MNIRTRLTLLFIVIVAIINILASLSIYFFSADYREDSFYNRLSSRANNTAKLLLEVDEVDADLLRRIERNNPMSLSNEKISIFNYRNEILYSSDEDSVIKADIALLNQIRLEGELRFRQGEYEVIGFLFKDRYDRVVVVEAAQDIYGMRKMANLRLILLAVFGVSIFVVSLAGWFFAGKALQPISRVIKRVDEISINRLNLRVDEGAGQDEMAHLAKTFNNMLERLEASFHVQREFIANASHELRTPLTAITGQLEVTLLNERTADGYKKVLESLLEDIRYVNKLSNRLLLLAQTSTEVSKGQGVPLRVDELLWQAREELNKSQSAYDVIIDFDNRLDDERLLTIAGDEALLKVAFINLMENGCKYSPDHRVEVHVKHRPQSLQVDFKDRGIGIPDENLSQIFEPFHRGSNAQHAPGHGIGLSLVWRIVRLHGGNVKVQTRLNKGTTFTVVLPMPS